MEENDRLKDVVLSGFRLEHDPELVAHKIMCFLVFLCVTSSGSLF